MSEGVLDKRSLQVAGGATGATGVAWQMGSYAEGYWGAVSVVDGFGRLLPWNRLAIDAGPSRQL